MPRPPPRTPSNKRSAFAYASTPLFRNAREDELTDLTLVGAGQYGTVYRALWHGNCPLDRGDSSCDGAGSAVLTDQIAQVATPPGSVRSPFESLTSTPTSTPPHISLSKRSNDLKLSFPSVSSSSTVESTGSLPRGSRQPFRDGGESLNSTIEEDHFSESRCPTGCPDSHCCAVQVAVKKTEFNVDEARMLALVSHRNVVKMFAACTTRPNCFIVTEYCGGGSLHEVLERYEDIAADYKLEWIQQLAKGMSYLHHDCPRRIVHRDLKSPNAVLNESLSVLKICDFGCSNAMTVSRSIAPLTGFVGTPNWMSPEAIRPQDNVPLTEKCDVWSYGVCVWEIFTQESPFDDFTNPYQVILKLGRYDGKSDILPIPKGIPKIYADLMRECWELAPQNRPSFQDIIIALEQNLENHEEVECQLTQINVLTQSKGGWRNDIDSSTAMPIDQVGVLADRMAEIEVREARLTEREQALEMYLKARDGNISIGMSGRTRSGDYTVPGGGSVAQVRHRPHNLVEWSQQEVEAWIAVLPNGLRGYENAFREHNIDGELLARITHTVLRDELGIMSFGHREGILAEIAKAKRDSSFPALSSTPRGENKAAVTMNIRLIFTVDSNVDGWSISASVVGEAGINRHDEYVRAIEFTISTEDSSQPVIHHSSNPPFVCSGTNKTKSGKVTVISKTTFTNHFKRKTTRVILNAMKPGVVTQPVTLQLKKSFQLA